MAKSSGNTTMTFNKPSSSDFVVTIPQGSTLPKAVSAGTAKVSGQGVALNKPVTHGTGSGPQQDGGQQETTISIGKPKEESHTLTAPTGSKTPDTIIYASGAKYKPSTGIYTASTGQQQGITGGATQAENIARREQRQQEEKRLEAIQIKRVEPPKQNLAATGWGILDLPYQVGNIAGQAYYGATVEAPARVGKKIVSATGFPVQSSEEFNKQMKSYRESTGTGYGIGFDLATFMGAGKAVKVGLEGTKFLTTSARALPFVETTFQAVKATKTAQTGIKIFETTGKAYTKLPKNVKTAAPFLGSGTLYLGAEPTTSAAESFVVSTSKSNLGGIDVTSSEYQKVRESAYNQFNTALKERKPENIPGFVLKYGEENIPGAKAQTKTFENIFVKEVKSQFPGAKESEVKAALELEKTRGLIYTGGQGFIESAGELGFRATAYNVLPRFKFLQEPVQAGVKTQLTRGLKLGTVLAGMSIPFGIAEGERSYAIQQKLEGKQYNIGEAAYSAGMGAVFTSTFNFASGGLIGGLGKGSRLVQGAGWIADPLEPIGDISIDKIAGKSMNVSIPGIISPTVSGTTQTKTEGKKTTTGGRNITISSVLGITTSVTTPATAKEPTTSPITTPNQTTTFTPIPIDVTNTVFFPIPGPPTLAPNPVTTLEPTNVPIAVNTPVFTPISTPVNLPIVVPYSNQGLPPMLMPGLGGFRGGKGRLTYFNETSAAFGLLFNPKSTGQRFFKNPRRRKTINIKGQEYFLKKVKTHTKARK